jgi:DNA modification methylase
MTTTIYLGDCRAALRQMPAGSVHCVVTSPPYYGLRDYGVEGQLGLERVPDCLGWATGEPCGECYVCHLVEVFREVRRVLRDDGTVWLNLGDSYAGGGNGGGGSFAKDGIKAAKPGSDKNVPSRSGARGAVGKLKRKDLMLMPHRVALALQADGWWVRSDIVWAKGNALPESVIDRPARAHEYVFLLAQSRYYFYDHVAVKQPAADSSQALLAGPKDEAASPPPRDNFRRAGSKRAAVLPGQRVGSHRPDRADTAATGTRNARSVWTIATQPFPDAHFAVFPEALVEPCVLAGTPAGGCCPACGAPYRRVVSEPQPAAGRGNVERKVATEGERSRLNTHLGSSVPWSPTVAPTRGWEPTCQHEAGPTVAAVVLDVFGGSGTLALVAERLGRDAVLCELNPEYVALAARRIREGAPLLARVEIVTVKE